MDIHRQAWWCMYPTKLRGGRENAVAEDGQVDLVLSLSARMKGRGVWGRLGGSGGSGGPGGSGGQEGWLRCLG